MYGFKRLGVVHIREVLLPDDEREINVDGLGIVVERRRFAQDGDGAEDGSDTEEPEEEPVEDHRDVAPILVLLRE